MFAANAFAAGPNVIPVWPGAAPGSESWKYDETTSVGPSDGLRRVGNVTRPTLTVFLPDKTLANGTAVIVCPGGGFRWLSVDHEGAAVAQWLNSIGVTAFVLKYRLMHQGGPGEDDQAWILEQRKTVIPLAVADGQQAMKLVRAHAADYGIAPDRIGIMGFSAGGHVAAQVALKHDAQSRPAFVAPIYPGPPIEPVVPADAPPLFMVHADDDKGVSTADNSIPLYLAWKKAGIPAEYHIYSQGGHGFGMRKRGLPVDSWTDRLKDWLDAQGLLKKSAN
ncbi:MAG TPA: alpha/beta hydrolase [Terriglobales bacterium]|nr:alpha/beta hydrolase [Terriglobales bacterium]